MDRQRRDTLAAWASIMGFAFVLVGKAWDLLTMTPPGLTTFYELGFLTIGVVCGGLYLKWKWEGFREEQARMRHDLNGVMALLGSDSTARWTVIERVQRLEERK